MIIAKFSPFLPIKDKKNGVEKSDALKSCTHLNDHNNYINSLRLNSFQHFHYLKMAWCQRGLFSVTRVRNLQPHHTCATANVNFLSMPPYRTHFNCLSPAVPFLTHTLLVISRS